MEQLVCCMCNNASATIVVMRRSQTPLFLCTECHPFGHALKTPMLLTLDSNKKSKSVLSLPLSNPSPRLHQFKLSYQSSRKTPKPYISPLWQTRQTITAEELSRAILACQTEFIWTPLADKSEANRLAQVLTKRLHRWGIGGWFAVEEVVEEV